MKLQKWFMVILLISLVVSFSVYGANNTICAIDKDAAAKDISKIIHQFQRNDFNISEGIFDKNIIWKYEGVAGTVPYAGTFSGKKGVKAFWRTYLHSVLVTKSDLRYVVRQGNILHLHWTEEGIVKSTGKRYAMETVQRWEFNDKGKIVKMRWYNDTYALYHAFQRLTDRKLSIALHPADYKIKGDGPVDALTAVQQYYGLFAAGDLQTIINNVTPDFVWIMAGPEGLTKIAGTWIGPVGFAGFFNALFTNETYNMFRLNTFITDGSRVDVEFEEEIVILETGKVAYCAGLHSIVVNSDGKFAKFRSYNNTYSVAWGYITD